MQQTYPVPLMNREVSAWFERMRKLILVFAVCLWWKGPFLIARSSIDYFTLIEG